MSSAWNKRLPGFYQQMLLIRRFEEACAKAYASQKIKGFCHLYIGEESVAVGAIGTLQKSDHVICTYRDHGHALTKGMSPRSVMAELFGKETGCSRGLGGSMHLFDSELGFMGGHGIVGGHVAVASGIAFASQYLRQRSVTLCFLGEGATNIGGFYEGITYAALWNLPVVFIIENNLYSMGTPIFRSQPLEDLSQKANGFGIPGKRFDAANVKVVYDEVKKAVNRARSGKGPTLLEAITYRFRGHSMSDPAKYRPGSELEEKKQKDPLKITHDDLIEVGIQEEQLTAWDENAKAQCLDAVQFAEESNFPDKSVLDQYTYV